MKKFFLYPFFAMFLSFAGSAFAQTVDTSNPDAMVQTVTQQVMSQIKGDKTIQSGDISKITQLVNEKILPYTDFRRTRRCAFVGVVVLRQRRAIAVIRQIVV